MTSGVFILVVIRHTIEETMCIFLLLIMVTYLIFHNIS